MTSTSENPSGNLSDAKAKNIATNRGGKWCLAGFLIVLGLVGLAAAAAIFSLTRPDAGALRKEAETAYLAGDYEQAAELADRALKLTAEDPQAVFLLGKARERLGEFEPALDAFARIPESEGALWLEAKLKSGRILMHHLGRPTEAERVFRNILRVDPDHVFALSELTTLLGVVARQPEAVPLILKLFQQGLVTVDFLTLLDSSGGRLQNPALWERFCQQSPDDPNVRLGSAWQAWHSPSQVDLDLAREILEEGLADHPDFPPLRQALVQVLWDQGDIADAAAHLKYCFEQEPVPAKMWIIRGHLAEHQKQTPAAIRCYWEAYRLNPDREATFHLAETLTRLGEEQLAEELRIRVKDLEQVRQTSDILLSGEHTTTRPMQEMVNDLAKVCRLWEAWGWCQVAAKIVPRQRWHRKQSAALLSQLGNCPDQQTCRNCEKIEMDFSDFPLPDWNSIDVPATSLEVDSSPAISFRDDAEQSGLGFQYFNSPHPAGSGQRMYEFPGGGCAVLDYDGDGWPDLYLTQGCRWPAKDAETEHVDRLFRNLGDGRFEDATAQAGLVENRFSTGVAAGDFDNDGLPDLYVANLDGNRLFHNNGDGTFDDVGQASGTSDPAWTSSCLMADLNGDALPDIYSVNYLQGRDVYDRICRHADGRPRMCMPFHFEGAQDQLFLNRGDGRFENATTTAGIEQHDGKGLGAVAGDFTGDGKLDLFVANDTVMNFLFVNQTETPGGRPTFVEEGLQRGVAINGSGKAEGCMGIAAGDVDGDGRLDLFVTNFHQETNTLYRQTQAGLFRDRTQESDLAKSSLTQLGFGAQFLDADLDGQLDLITTNGHIDDLTYYGRPYRMPTQFFHNRGAGRFYEIPPAVLGTFFKEKALGRGMAKCDWNRDGREDVVISYLDRPVALLTNTTSDAGNYLALQFCGVDSNRDAIGLKVRLRLGDNVITRFLAAEGGYQACNQMRLVFGLGSAERVDELEIHWPSGKIQRFPELMGNQELLFIESASQPRPLHVD